MKDLKWLGLAEARSLVVSGVGSFLGFGRVGRLAVVLLRLPGVSGVVVAVVGVGSRPVPGVSAAAAAFVASWPAGA